MASAGPGGAVTSAPAGSGAARSSNPFSLSSRPTCPSILIPFEGHLYALPVQKLNISTEFNVSTAFVRITGTWRNIASYRSDCIFVLPMSGTVTSVNIKIENRIFETVVIPTTDAERLKSEQETKNGPSQESKQPHQLAQGELPPMFYEDYIPNLFRLPISGVNSCDFITVTVVYIEPLVFADGQYNFTLPLCFGSNLIPAKKKMSDIISINCTINSVAPNTQWTCKTHEMETVQYSFARVVLAARASTFDTDMKHDEGGTPKTDSRDFSISYAMSSEHILPSLIKEVTANATSLDEEGNFLMFVTPPSLDQVQHFFTRNMIFLIDRSGSMNGEPYQEAIRALSIALRQLTPSDHFSIIVFDHRQEYYRRSLVPATPDEIENATTWIKTYQPERGGTDIQAPLEWSLKHLEGLHKPGSLVLPFVVLLTDGCVGNERELCRFTNTYCKNTRILTFGIGSYCNWFFLKMLAQIGRGFSDVVVYKEKIFGQMLQLLNMASVPVITNIEFKISGVREVELYPFPIPDLFMGAPLTVAGKYKGQFPDEVTIIGRMADGNQFSMGVVARESDVIPVGKVFIKQRLDLLTARSWLEESKALEAEIVELSCSSSMPSAYTTMVAYETTNEKKQGLDEELKSKKWYRDPKKVAALAVGNCVLVGAIAFSFGDVAGTVGNLPVVGGVLDVLGGGSCCCEGCGCDVCGDCLAC